MCWLSRNVPGSVLGANSGNHHYMQGSEQECDAKHILITQPGQCSDGAALLLLDQHFECPLGAATFPSLPHVHFAAE